MSDEELVKKFQELAIIHGELNTAKEANRAYRGTVEIWKELHARGQLAIEMFTQLLDSKSMNVRLLAAADMLFVDPERAVPVLEQIAQDRNAANFMPLTASTTLEEWRAGRLKRFT